MFSGSRLNLDSSEKGNFGPVIFCVPSCNSGTTPDSSTSVVRTNEKFPSGDYTVERPALDPSLGSWLRNHFAYPVIPEAVKNYQGQECCCCTKHFGILSSWSVIFFGRPDLALLAQLAVSMDLDQKQFFAWCLSVWRSGWPLLQPAACRSSSVWALPSGLCHAPSLISTEIMLLIPIRQSYVQTTFKLWCFGFQSCCHISFELFHDYTCTYLRWDNMFGRDVYIQLHLRPWPGSSRYRL